MKDETRAFPVPEEHKTSGMFLRDYFAAKAMQGLSTTSGEYRGNESGKEFIDGISKISYMIADAMIEARNK